MLSAHFAPALVAKSFRPQINLSVAMIFCMLPDLLHALLVLLGLERFAVKERYSHTLLSVFLMSLAVFGGSLLLDVSMTDASIYAMCVLSHFVFDLLNRARMAVTPWGGWIPGVGFHERATWGRAHHISFILEIILVVISVFTYGYSVFDGELRSLFVPAGLLGMMLMMELGYYQVYAPVIESTRLKWR